MHTIDPGFTIGWSLCRMNCQIPTVMIYNWMEAAIQLTRRLDEKGVNKNQRPSTSYIHIYNSLLGPGPGPTGPVKDISLRAPVCTLSFPHYPLEARSCKLLSSRAWTTSAYFSGVSKSAAREGISWHSWWHRATMSPTWDLFSFCWKLNFSLSA